MDDTLKEMLSNINKRVKNISTSEDGRSYKEEYEELVERLVKKERAISFEEINDKLEKMLDSIIEKINTTRKLVLTGEIRGENLAKCKNEISAILDSLKKINIYKKYNQTLFTYSEHEQISKIMQLAENLMKLIFRREMEEEVVKVLRDELCNINKHALLSNTLANK